MNRILAVAVVAGGVLAPGVSEAQPPDTVMAQDGLYQRPFIASVGSTALGGYVEGNTNYFVEDGIGDGFSMELRRFNLFLFSRITSRLRFISELEFEHGTEEIALETAQLDFTVGPALTLRGGVLLPPLGFVNQNHDSPRWNFVERPLVSTEIIPSTLSEVGFGLLGKVFPGSLVVSYDLYLTNGLGDGIVGNETGRTHIPSGRSGDALAEDNNGSPAWSGRVAVAHPAWGELGGSFYTGYYNTFRIEGDEVDEQRRVSIFALDGRAEFDAVQLRGEVALADIDVPGSLSELHGHRQWGGHLDVTVPVWQPTIAGHETPSVLSLDLRVERIDMNVGTFGSTGRKIFDETTAVVPGLAFRPSGNAVLRVNYRREWIRDLLGNPTIVRAGYQIGLAAYF